MKITRENTTPTKVKLTIVLDADELAAAEKVALHKLSKTVKVDGFRKGKVPASVAAKHVDPAHLAEETVDNAISKAVADAFIGENINVLQRPEVELTKFEPGKTVEFTAEAEVIPEIKLGDYKKLSVAKPEKVSIKKSEVDEVIERLRTQMATKADVKRAAKLGDEVVIDFVGMKDGVAFDGGTATDYELELGSNSFIPGFEEGLVGHKAGDKADLKLKFPKEYQAAELAGKDVVFETTVKAVHEKVKPELNDEFAAKTGSFTSLDELQADIKRELTTQAEQRQQDELRDEVVAKLVEKSDVPTPDVLVEDQLGSIEQDAMQNLMYQGRSLEDYFTARKLKDRDEWVEKELKPMAIQRVQAGLALSELSKLEKITISDDELAARVAEFRKAYEKQPEMAKRFDEPEVQRDIANRLMTEKTIDHLIKLNTK